MVSFARQYYQFHLLAFSICMVLKHPPVITGYTKGIGCSDAQLGGCAPLGVRSPRTGYADANSSGPIVVLQRRRRIARCETRVEVAGRCFYYSMTMPFRSFFSTAAVASRTVFAVDCPMSSSLLLYRPKSRPYSFARRL